MTEQIENHEQIDQIDQTDQTTESSQEWNTLAATIHEAAVKKGFWDDLIVDDSDVIEKLMAVTREVEGITDPPTEEQAGFLEDVRREAEIVENKRKVLKVRGQLSLNMLIVTECSEAAIAHIQGELDNFAEELADIGMRILDVCGGYGVDIDKAVKIAAPLDQIPDTATILERLFHVVNAVSNATEALRVDQQPYFNGWMGYALARLLRLAEHTDVDLAAAMLVKIRKNEARPHKNNRLV